MKSGKSLLMVSSLLAVAAFALIFGVLFFGLNWSMHNDTSEVKSPLIGKPAPEFTLPRLLHPGQTLGKSDFLGKPYLLNVWGSWCFACREEHPTFMQYAEQLGVPFVGFNYIDKTDEAIGWLERYGNPYSHVIVDESGDTAFHFGVYGAPETFMIDAAGIIRYKHVGVVTETIMQQEIQPLLQQLLREADS